MLRGDADVVNIPLVPTPERGKKWWECSKPGCDHVVQATSRPDVHDKHPTFRMRALD